MEELDNKKEICSKIEKMKQRYNKTIFNKSIENQKNQSIVLPDETEIELIEESINTIKEYFSKTEQLTNTNSKAFYLSKILEETRKISEYVLTYEQAKEIYNLISNKEIINLKDKKIYDKYIERMQNITSMKLINCISRQIDETDDVEKLKELERIIPNKCSLITYTTVKSKINNKIIRLQQEKDIIKARNNISPEIIKLVEHITLNKISTKKAMYIIEQEAEKIINNNKNNKLKMTLEQAKKLIITKINICITSKAEQYPIKSSIATIEILREISENNYESIRVVIKNLEERKQYTTAKKVCDKYIEISDDEDKKLIKILKEDIINSEIGDIIQKILERNSITQEDISAYEMLEKNIKTGRIKPYKIKITKNNSKIITLQDIWQENRNRSK